MFKLFFKNHVSKVLCSASDNTCQNNATCFVNTGQVLCICPTGYKGTYCETSIDDCLSGPCQNSGKCISYLDGYSCNCTSKFYGYNCENRKKNYLKINNKICFLIDF